MQESSRSVCGIEPSLRYNVTDASSGYECTV